MSSAAGRGGARVCYNEAVSARNAEAAEETEMAKIQWKASPLLAPVPAVMVTCADAAGKPNIITLAWAGTVCSDPPMLSISVRKERYSHALIRERGEFAVCLGTKSTAKALDLCGVKSGRDVDKFRAAGLTPEPASAIGVPIIKECPVVLECRVKQVLELGSHDLFVAEIVAVDVEDSLVDAGGKLDLEKAGLIGYAHGNYYGLGARVGFFGFSVASPDVLKRRS
jgi:flavin reductase (DIM6/NTAB) family NADH-FMN oxidoreductase RutF